MPPVGGIGLDRGCLIVLGRDNIRDAIHFPQLNPK